MNLQQLPYITKSHIPVITKGCSNRWERFPCTAQVTSSCLSFACFLEIKEMTLLCKKNKNNYILLLQLYLLIIRKYYHADIIEKIPSIFY